MRASATRPWRVETTSVVLRVRVTPKSTREAVSGTAMTADGPAFNARVRAVPEDGAANAAVIALVADWLGVAKRSVTLAAGAKSRIKSLSIVGDVAALEATLAARLAGFAAQKDD